MIGQVCHQVAVETGRGGRGDGEKCKELEKTGQDDCMRIGFHESITSNERIHIGKQ